MQITAAVCEIDNCGVQAIGRCATCKRAFCTSHQGHDFQKNIMYVNMCAPCFAQTPAEVERVRRTQIMTAYQAAKDYFALGSAQKALLAAGLQSIQIYRVETHKIYPKRNWFSKLIDDTDYNIAHDKNYKLVEEVTPFRLGWILGKFCWGPKEEPNRLTALLDLMGNSYLTNPLAQVQLYSGQDMRYAGNYVFVTDQGFDGGVNYPNLEISEWFKVLQATKQLAGESS